MSGGLRELFRSCRILVAVIMVAGTLSAHAQSSIGITAGPQPSVSHPHALYTSVIGGQGAAEPGADTIVAKLAVQVDTAVVVPGQRNFLEPNVPNPFGLASNVTTIAFTLVEDSKAELRIYDFFYNEVVTLVNTDLLAGRHVIRFLPPATMPTGMYFYELKSSRGRDLQRMMYIK